VIAGVPAYGGDEKTTGGVLAAATDAEFRGRLEVLVGSRQELIRVVPGKVDKLFQEAIASSADLESEEILTQQVRSFRLKGTMPVHPDLIDLAAQEQMVKCAASMAVYQLLREAREFASEKKWKESWDFCNEALESLSNRPEYFDPCLYSVLESGLKTDLKGVGSTDSENHVALEVIERGQGTVTLKLSGAFGDAPEWAIDREVTLTIPVPSVMERINRSLPEMDGTLLRESEDSNAVVMNVSRGAYEDEFRRMEMTHEQDFAVYESVIVLKGTSGARSGVRIRSSEEVVAEMTRRAIARADGDLFADLPSPAPLPEPKVSNGIAVRVAGDLIQNCPTFMKADKMLRGMLGAPFDNRE
jgi:hypothetical protein